MKFKTKEDIIKMDEGESFCECYITGVTNTFLSFRERFNFYKNNCVEETFSVYYAFQQLEKKQKEDPELFALWKKQKTMQWNEWLFKHCFGDLIK